jgi:hypothetical protein
MTLLSDDEWEQQAEFLADAITDLIDGKDSDMIIEVLACIVADMLAPFESNDGIALVLAFTGQILEKAYGLNAEMTSGRIQ